MLSEQDFEFIVAQMKKFAVKAMNCLKQTDKILASENPDRVSAFGFLSQAGSLMRSAEVIYYSHYDDLMHNDIEHLFEQFDTFVWAALASAENDYNTNAHSEYCKLKDEFSYCVLSQ